MTTDPRPVIYDVSTSELQYLTSTGTAPVSLGGGGGGGGGSDTGMVSLKQFGVVSDGSDQRAAIQSAIDSGEDIYVNPPASGESYFVDGSLQLRSGLTLWGNSKWKGVEAGYSGDHVFVGNGADPLFITGAYPSGVGTDNRDITFIGFSARNNGAQVIDSLTASNFHFERCALQTYDFEDPSLGTINMRYSYRCTFKENMITASGGAFAISAYDNCNAINGQHNTITGGSAGGAIDIGQSQNVCFNHSIIESSLIGIRAGAASGITGAGTCTGLNFDDTYMEDVGSAYDIATGYDCYGLSIKRGIIGNQVTGNGFAEDYIFKLGFIVGWEIGGGIYIKRRIGGSKELIQFKYRSAFPKMAIEGSDKGIFYQNGSGGKYAYDSFPSTDARGYLAGFNQLQPVLGAPASGERVWESDTLAANVTYGTIAVVPPDSLGGVVHSVEVFEARGTLTGSQVNIGSAVNGSEIANFYPASLTLTQGSAIVTLTDSGSPVAGEVLLRFGSQINCWIGAGTGTGTYRIRVRYREL